MIHQIEIRISKFWHPDFFKYHRIQRYVLSNHMPATGFQDLTKHNPQTKALFVGATFEALFSPRRVLIFPKVAPFNRVPISIWITHLVISGMEADGGDEVDVLEAAETFSTRDVPQPHSFVHRRRQDEVVLQGTVHVHDFNSNSSLFNNFTPLNKCKTLPKTLHLAYLEN